VVPKNGTIFTLLYNLPVFPTCEAESTDKAALCVYDLQVKAASHNVVDLSTHLRRTLRRGVRYCERHPDEPVDMYCFECRIALCSCCSSGRTHRTHRSVITQSV